MDNSSFNILNYYDFSTDYFIILIHNKHIYHNYIL